MAHTVYIALGSNLGDRAANLRAAVNALAPAARVQRVSSIYETPPWGFADQPAFLNQVLRAQTDLEAGALLAALKKLEERLGRTASFRYGPRVIDLDILFFDDEVLELPGLSVPHPRIAERAFVLVPLAEIAPHLLHPLLGRTPRQLLEAVDPGGIQRVQPAPVLPWGARTYVMGILNLTSDSFSGDGLLNERDVAAMALEQAVRFVEAGVDILDIGGESTRPGAQPVEAPEEMARVLPVLRELARADLGVLLSVDTYKAGVAEAALQAGAHWINDVWGLRADPEMAAVAARHQAPVILMHNRSKPGTAALEARLGGRYVGMAYDDLLPDVCRELMESVALARAAGVADENIILDPGIGFGKTVEQNLALIRRLDEVKALGYPLLLGPSRKSFIGYTLNLPPEQRMEGTLAACVLGIQRGADILRVHDVAAAVRAARLTDAVLRA